MMTDCVDTPTFNGETPTGIKWDIYAGNALETLKSITDRCFDCVVTSPPYYWLRDYGVDGQLGKENSVEEYVVALANIMDEVYRLLADDGLLFLNIGDTYYSGKGKSHGTDKKSSKRRFGLRAVDKSGGLGIGLQPKSLIGVPWRVAIEMMRRKWILRSDIIWNREHYLPEAVEDRPHRSYEHIFMFAKSRKYKFNRAALGDEQEIWTISARPKSSDVRTAPYPDELVDRCLNVGCKPGGYVLDPFMGSGTTLRVAVASGRHALGIDINPEFCEYAARQLTEEFL